MYRFGDESGIDLPEYKNLVEFFEDVYRIHRKKETLIFPHDVLDRMSKKLTYSAL